MGIALWYPHRYVVDTAVMQDNGIQQVAYVGRALGFFLPPIEHAVKPGDTITLYTVGENEWSDVKALGINNAPPIYV